MKEKTKKIKPKTRKRGTKQADGLSIPIFNAKGKEVEKFVLDKELFTGQVNKALLYQAVRMYNANDRQGTVSTKTRSDVSGGGKKPWRQKGTGRARAGSIRSPLWRGGGVVFGPHPRDFHYDMPKKVKRLALLASLNSKFAENRWVGIDTIQLDEPKTKKFKAVMDALKLKGHSLFILDEIDEKIRIASRNLAEASVRNYKDFNTMDVLANDNIVISKGALEKLPERFKL